MLSYPETRDLYMAEILGRKMFKQRPEYEVILEERRAEVISVDFIFPNSADTGKLVLKKKTKIFARSIQFLKSLVSTLIYVFFLTIARDKNIKSLNLFKCS
jgi:hypothetical protein